MASCDFDSFIRMLRRTFSRYIDEALIDSLEDSVIMDDHEKASSLATKIFQKIPQHLLTDRVVQGIESIQNKSQRQERLVGKSLVEKKTATKRIPSNVHGGQTRITDTDVATIGYYLHILARGIQEKDRRDIQSVLKGCDQQKPLIQDVYKIACGVEDMVIQIKSREKATLLCLAWCEDALKNMLDKDDVHTDGIPSVSREAMFDKRERVIIESTHRLLEKLKKRLRDNIGREDFQQKIEALEKRNAELKDKLSTLRKQIEAKVEQLSKAHNDSDNNQKAQTKIREILDTSLERVQQAELKNTTKKERNKQNVDKSDLPNGEEVRTVKGESNELKIISLPYEDVDYERSNTVQEELRQLKEKTNNLSKDLHRKQEQNKRLLQRESELTKEIADLRQGLKEAEIVTGHTRENGTTESPLEGIVHVRERDYDSSADVQDSNRLIDTHGDESRIIQEIDSDDKTITRDSQRKPPLEDKVKRNNKHTETSVMPKPVISLPFMESMPLAQTEETNNTYTSNEQYSVDDIDQFFTEESQFKKRPRATEKQRYVETIVDCIVEAPVVESRSPHFSKPHDEGRDTNQFEHTDSGLSDKVHRRKSLKDRVKPSVLQSGSVMHWKKAKADKTSEDTGSKSKELNEQVIKPDTYNDVGWISPTTGERDQLDRTSLDTDAKISLEDTSNETQSPLYRSLEEQNNMTDYNSGHSGTRDETKSLKDRVKPCILESGSVKQWKKTKAEHKPKETRPPPRGPINDVIEPEHSDSGLTATITEKRDQQASSLHNDGKHPESELPEEDVKRNLKERMKPCLLGSSSVNNWKETVTRPQTQQNSGIGLVKERSSEKDTSQLQEEILRLNKRNEQLERQMEQQQRNLESKLDTQRRDVRSVRSDLEQDKDGIQRRYQNKIDQLQRDIRNLKSDIGEDKDDLLKRLRQSEAEQSELKKTNNQLEREKKELEEKLQLAMDENERHIDTAQQLEKEKGSTLTGKTPDTLESTAVEQWKETAKKSKQEKAASGNSFLDTNDKTLQELEEENRQLQEEIKHLKTRLGETHDDNGESEITVDNGLRPTLKNGVKKYMVGTASINQWKEPMTDSQTENVVITTGVTEGSQEEQVKRLLAENTHLSHRLQEAESKVGLSDHSDKGLKPLNMETGHIQDSYQDKLENQQREIRSVKSDLEQDKNDIQRRYQNRIDQQKRDIRNVRSDLEEDKDDLQRRLRQYESEKSDQDRTINQLEKEKRDLEQKLQQAIDEKETHVEEDKHLEKERSNVHTRNKADHLESSAIQQWKETATKSKTEKSKPGNSNENPNEELHEEIRQLQDENARLKERLQIDGEEHNNSDQEKTKKSLRDRVKPYVLESASVSKWQGTVSETDPHSQTEETIEDNSDGGGETGNAQMEEMKQLVEENRLLNKSLQDAECRIRDLEKGNPGFKSQALENENVQNSYQGKLDEQERDLHRLRSDLEDDNDDVQRRYKNKIDQMQREIRNARRDIEEEKDDLRRRLRETESEKNDIDKTLNQLKQEKQDMEEKLRLVEDESNRHIETVKQLEKGQASGQTRVKPEHLELTAANHWAETAKKAKTEKSNPENRTTPDNVALTGDEDWLEKLKSLADQTSKPKNTATDKPVRLEELEVQVIYLESEKKSADLRNAQMKRKLVQQQHQLEKVQSELLQVQAMNDDLKSRFSKVAGDQLIHDNPNIADLGDTNRPTKLAEQFSELYDNEWTDAFSAIEEKSSNTIQEEDIIHQLREILLNCFDQLTKISAEQITGIKSLLLSPWSSLTVSSEIQMTTEQARTITQLRKQTTALAIDSIKQEIIKEYQENTYYRELKPFIEKCSEICWLMVIQSPPVAIDYRHRPGDRFDKDVFKAYTKSGKVIEFVVWPPVYLHKGGPLLCKGIAQGKR